MRKEIMGVTFDDVTLEEAVAAGEALAAGPGFSYVVTPNPEIVAMARQTETYRRFSTGPAWFCLTGSAWSTRRRFWVPP